MPQRVKALTCSCWTEDTSGMEWHNGMAACSPGWSVRGGVRPFSTVPESVFTIKEKMRFPKEMRCANLQERSRGSVYTALSALTGRRSADQWAQPTWCKVRSSSPNSRPLLPWEPNYLGMEWFSFFIDSHQTRETFWPGNDIISSVKTETVM